MNGRSMKYMISSLPSPNPNEHGVMMWGAHWRKWVKLQIFKRLNDKAKVWYEGLVVGCCI